MSIKRYNDQFVQVKDKSKLTGIKPVKPLPSLSNRFYKENNDVWDYSHFLGSYFCEATNSIVDYGVFFDDYYPDRVKVLNASVFGNQAGNYNSHDFIGHSSDVEYISKCRELITEYFGIEFIIKNK